MATQTPKKPNGTAIAHATPEIRPLGIARRDPFYGFDAMRNMLDSFLGEPFLPETLVDLPTVNLYEKNGLYTLECAVPGYKKDDISVEARGDQVTISGTYAETKHDERAHYHHREIRRGSFTRTVVLPQDVDPDKVSAKLENGLLTVTLQPTKAISSKSIPIQG